MSRAQHRQGVGGSPAKAAGVQREQDQIAIIGMACRLPGGVDSPAAFWELLRTGRDAVQDEPPARFNADPYFHPDPSKGRLYTKAGGFLEQVELFDAAFFGISPREAMQMDPQQRLMLEMTWEALEDAGLVVDELAGSQTAVYVGVSNNDHAYAVRLEPESSSAYTNSGSALSIVANRISHIFDLRGPSLAIDTACSSSLVAVHEACRDLLAGESSLALAGGVNILLDPLVSAGFCKASMLSPTGRCRAFDAAADGYIRAEGGGVLVLKRLDRALADGDRIHAVILATGVNSDGRTQGLALPNPDAQRDLLREVYARAGLEPSEIAYVEAHGTGTATGDPTECRALGEALGARRAEPLRIGSVKTNLGHLEPASGVASLIKVVLSLKQRELPPSLHLSTPNPAIPFEELKLAVVTETQRLGGADPLVMGLNSFGFGGTNAHAVLREYPRKDQPRASEGVPETSLLLLSAKSPEALSELAGRYAEMIEAEETVSLWDVCRTAATRRAHHAHRVALLASRREEVALELASLARGERAPSAIQARALAGGVRTTFVFSGNASQWAGMGRGLISSDEAFHSEVEAVSTLLQPLLGWSVLDELLADPAASRLHLTEVAQPLLFALQVALVERLQSLGLSPDAVVGHSVGEVAAAYAARALSLEAACRVIAERSRTQGQTAGLGRMVAVGLSAERAAEEISAFAGRISIAGINSPRSVTLAGDEAALDELGAGLQPQGIFFRKLDLNYAFHTPAMDRIEPQVRKALSDLAASPSELPFVSTVTGGEVPGERLNSQYWWDNIRQPVRFGDAIQSLLNSGAGVFVEIGPHPTLRSYVRECLEAEGREGILVPTLLRGEDDRNAILNTIARCYAAGSALDYGSLFPERGPHLALPYYPWQRRRFWPEERSLSAQVPRHPLLGDRLSTTDPTWENRIDPHWPRYLSHHVVHGAIVFPATAYIELALAALNANGWGDRTLQNLEIERPLVFAEGAARWVEVCISEERRRVRIRSRARRDAAAVTHAVVEIGGEEDHHSAEPVSIEALTARLPHKFCREEHYSACKDRGLDYGPAFQGIAEIYAGDGEALGRLGIPDAIASELANYRIHPALLDACFQVLIGAVLARNSGDVERDTTYLPIAAGRIRLPEEAGLPAYAHARLTLHSSLSLMADLTVLDGKGTEVLEIDGLRFRRLERTEQSQPQLYEWYPRLVESPAVPLGDTVSCSTLALRAEAELTKPKAVRRRERYYGIVRDELNQLATAYAERAIRSLTAGAGSFTPASLIEGGVIAESQRKFFDYLLRLLAQDGSLHTSPSGWMLDHTSGLRDPDELWRQLFHRHPDYFPELHMMGRCGRYLEDILRGARDPLQVVLPYPATDVLEHLFESGNVLRSYNDAAAAALGELARLWPQRRILRILEIGGGTGGLTSALLPELPPDRTDYLFSDIGQPVIERAEEKFRGFPFLRCAILDIERDPVEQGLPSQGFDVIVAANVLHATADLRSTLRNVRRLLAPAGLQLLIETHGERFIHFMFGLLKGWWLFADRDLRTESPLLSASVWRRLLAQEGFDEISLLHEVREDECPSHSLILARNSRDELPSRSSGDSPCRDLRNWLAFTEPSDNQSKQLIENLTRHLRAHGHRVITVEPGDHFRRIDADHFALPPRRQENYESLCEALDRDGIAISDALHLWGLVSPSQVEEHDLLEHQDRRSLSLVFLARALTRAGAGELPRLWVVTACAFPSPTGSSALYADQAPPWGVVRTLMNEEPRLNCRLIDVDLSHAPDLVAEQLVREFSNDDDETEVLLRDGARYASRLREAEPASEVAPSDAFTLEAARRPRADEVVARSVERRPPAADEVKVRVHAAGVNFRDVLLAIGALPDEAVEKGAGSDALGKEFSGEITSVGARVRGFAAGDLVFGIAPSSFSSYVMANRKALWRKPTAMSFEEAATIPIAFLTAYLALHHLARLQRGERVLVHGACGGVGLAAIQLAKWRRAEIFATAGTDEKRELLHRLGIEHVFDSRSLSFADDVRKVTNGEGVDVVLNSLAGAAIERGISILRSGGRFLELGKRDIYANHQLGLRGFADNVSFFGVDLESLILERTSLVSRLAKKIDALLKAGVLRPLPYRVFPVERASEAFRYVRQSRHIGKVVLDFDSSRPPIHGKPTESLSLDPDGTYLVTGGLRGFGLASAKRLAARGARHLVLVGRTGAATAEAQDALRSMWATGANVRSARVDVSDASQVRRLIREIQDSGRSLRGVVHAAMVLSDVPFAHMTTDQWRSVLRPKVLGAWNLHRETRSLPLDFFVLYSSLAAAYGNPGQTNYAAANLFLESLAHQRRAQGLPGLAVVWSAIGDVGSLAENQRLRTRLADRFGLSAMASEEALDLLERLLASDMTVAGTARVDWVRLKRSVPRLAKLRVFELLGPDFGPETTLETELRGLEATSSLAALPQTQAVDLASQHLLKLVAAVLRIPTEQLDDRLPLSDLGMDSLMVVELAALIDSFLGVDLPSLEIADAPGIRDLAMRIVAAIQGGNPNDQELEEGRAHAACS